MLRTAKIGIISFRIKDRDTLDLGSQAEFPVGWASMSNALYLLKVASYSNQYG